MDTKPQEMYLNNEIIRVNESTKIKRARQIGLYYAILCECYRVNAALANHKTSRFPNGLRNYGRYLPSLLSIGSYMGTDKKVIHRSYMALGKSRILDFLHVENEVVRVCTRPNWIET